MYIRMYNNCYVSKGDETGPGSSNILSLYDTL